MKIIVGHICPNMLNLYGDVGNIATLKYRLNARNIDAEIIEYGIDDEIDFDALDILFIGGGGEREQKLVCEKLRGVKDKLISFAEAGGAVLAVCGGFEILGKWYKSGRETIEGVGLLDVTCEYADKRIIGNILIESAVLGTTVVGFENHSGRMDIGSHTPLGKVVKGSGNNGTDGYEGVIYKNVVATYLHGPLLPKNPGLADFILKNAIERKDKQFELLPLDDTAEIQAHEYMAGRLLNK